MAGAKTKKNTTGPADVDAYIAALPPEARAMLEQVRAVIKAAAPGGTESISYNMPTFQHGKARVYFSAWKSHCGLYGIAAPVLEAHREELKGRVMEKGTVKFPYAEPLPAALLTNLVKGQVAESEKSGTK